MVRSRSWTNYSRQRFMTDLASGVTVAVLLIPQSMAYAKLAGLPVIYGLYASTVPLFLYAALASSSQLQVGPVATTAVLLQSIVSAMNPADDAEYIRLAIAVSAVSGCVQVAFGVLRLGFVANFLSWPVMSGFTSAAAFIILSSQVKHLLGVSVPRSPSFVGTVANTVKAAANGCHPLTMVLSVLCLGVLLGAKKMTWKGKPLPRWFPTQLIVVAVSITLSFALSLSDYGVSIVGPIPAGFPTMSFPVSSVSEFLSMVPGGIALSIVSYVGAISLAVVFAKEVKEKVDANQELIALGTACVVGSFWQSHIISGSFTRTAINNEMGSTSPMAVVITGIIMVLSLLLLSPLFQYLPQFVLASMIVASLKSLVKVQDAVKFWNNSRPDFVQAAVSFSAVLLLGIDKGILLAMGFSLSLILYRSFQVRVTQTAAGASGTVPVLRIHGEVHFGNCKAVVQRLTGAMVAAGEPTRAPASGIANDSDWRFIVVDCSSVSAIDASACQALAEFVKFSHGDGCGVQFVGLDADVSAMMSRFEVCSPANVAAAVSPVPSSTSTSASASVCPRSPSSLRYRTAAEAIAGIAAK